MLRMVSRILAALLLLFTNAYSQDLGIHKFDGPKLNDSIWCQCQIDETNSPLKFVEADPKKGTKAVRLVAHEETLGGNLCRAEEATACRKAPPLSAKALNKEATGLTGIAPEGRLLDLGEEALFEPSIFDDADLEAQPQEIAPGAKALSTKTHGNNSFCTDEKLQEAKDKNEDVGHANDGHCMQREELRFHHDLRQSYDKQTIYELRYRMPPVIKDRKQSLRWVIAQWKHDLDPSYGGDRSPFVALRFDDGVPYITIQNDDCRCTIASGQHPDPKQDAKVAPGKLPSCKAKKSGAVAKICEKALNAKYGKQQRLTSPLGKFVDLSFQMRPSPKSGQLIIVENGREIVRMNGPLGYMPPPTGNREIKFKFGIYRAYQPTKDYIDVEWIKISERNP